jgi:hypothetical protein
VDDLESNKCGRCTIGWVTLDSIDVKKFPSDVAHHHKQIIQNLAKWELGLRPNILVTLHQACKAEGAVRMKLLMKAHEKADTHYYKMWAENKIDAKKKKGPPMPEEVKALLRRRKDPDPVNIEPLMTVSIKAIRKADVHGLRDLYWKVYGANAGPNLTSETMRRSLEYAVRELLEAKKRQPSPEDVDLEPPMTQLPDIDLDPESEKLMTAAVAKVPKPPKVAKPKVAKVPLYEDKAGQAEREAKWAWCVKGSWRADPEHDGGTLLDINCTVCGAERTIHAADLFQVKLCLACRSASKKKV